MRNKIKITIAQVAPKFADITANLDIHLKHIDKAVESGSDLIIFPELALSGYSLKDETSNLSMRVDDRRLDALREASKKIAVVTSFPELGSDFVSYISMAMFEGGRIHNLYRKVHPPTHGMFEELKYFGSGDSIAAFDTPFARVGMMICRDIWHPELSYVLSVDGAYLLLASSAIPARNINSDGFGIDESMTRTIANMALTNQAYVVLCNRVGVEEGVTFLGGSMVCAPNGTVVEKLPLLDESVISVTINLDEIRKTRDSLNLIRERKNRLILSELERILGKC